MEFFRILLERWLLLWLSLLSFLAYWWPNLIALELDPFTRSRPALPFLIAAIMFSVGCLLPPDEVKQVGKRWPTVVAGTLLQYTVMPLSAFMVAHLFAVDDATFIGLMVVGCVPGAMASNVLTLIARGNVSYSISLTTLATILSPLVVPLALYLTLQKHVDLDPVGVFVNLLLTVAVPVVLGFLVCRIWSRFANAMSNCGPIIANLIILWVIAMVVGLNRERMGQATLQLIGILLAINLLGYLAGYLGGLCLRLPESMRRALTIEIGMQNAGVGTYLALALFTETSAIAPAFYTFGCMFTGTVLARLWNWAGNRGLGPGVSNFSPPETRTQ